MSDEYKVDVDIEKAVATFRIDEIGKHNQESYKGVFVVKCLLNPIDFIAADKLYRELLGGKPSDAHEHASSLAFALSQLNYRIVKCPPFWENKEINGGHVEDNIIMEVINRALFCQEKYVKMKKEEAKKIEDELTKDILGGIIEKEPELDTVEDEEVELGEED